MLDSDNTPGESGLDSFRGVTMKLESNWNLKQWWEDRKEGI